MISIEKNDAKIAFNCLMFSVECLFVELRTKNDGIVV